MSQIIIGGDVMPGGINEPLFSNGDAQGILGDLLPIFQKADLTIVNLECPLLESRSPVLKSGPVLGVSVSCVTGLVESGIDIVGLANNHTMDHGVVGLLSTLDACTAAGIECIGAGENLQAASRIGIRNINGVRIGILALAEHEFGIASRQSWGVCPLDPIVFARAIFAQRNDYDLLIVMIHGGNEFYRYPRPSLQQTCRFLVELGANLVVCQHSHIVGCYEEYAGGYIVYGQGNFICAGNNKPAFWHEGFLVSLDVDNGRAPAFCVIPILQSDLGTPGARIMRGNRLDEFSRQLQKRCSEISDPGAVDHLWDEFCQLQEVLYLRRFGSPHRLFRLLDRYTGLMRYLLRQPRIRLDQLNLLRCESHREVLINLLSRN